MSGGGSSIFADAAGYQASLFDVFDLLALRPKEFSARLTWVALPRLHLLRAEESAPRVAYVRLPREQVFVFFLASDGPPVIYGGLELHFGDFIWHNQEARIHQRTTAGGRWASVSLTAETLMRFGRAMVGEALKAPSYPRVIRPAAADRRQLLRLHAQAGRIAETSLKRILNPAIVRSLEQEIAGLLVECLASAEANEGNPSDQQQARLCGLFEEMLRAGPFRLLSTREICSSLGASEPRFRASCLRLLGMGPQRYQRLRRLKLVCAELCGNDVVGQDVPAIIARYGFPNLHRFVTEYRDTYGEMPPLPAREAAYRRL